MISLAAAATICAFATVRIAWTRCVHRRGGLAAMVALGALSTLLVLAAAVVALASGPL